MGFIKAEGVCVDFPLYHGNARSLKKTVMSAAAGRLGQDGHKRIVVQALRDISFSLQPGDRLGLVGSNGAGKTTLLRTLAGIYEPIAGRIHVRGSLNALLDPNLGMNMDLTGRENIMLRGQYNGLNARQIRALEEDVQDFADLREFIDLPVRIYSSGMIVRLGFALATAIRPQILLMDEWFLAGDITFMDRAKARVEAMVRGAEILVLSSHQTDTIATWCSQALWLHHGRVRDSGPAAEVVARYVGGHPRPLAVGDVTMPAVTAEAPMVLPAPAIVSQA
jgi:lipopolysaccharide transport system ATP-binding protein